VLVFFFFSFCLLCVRFLFFLLGFFLVVCFGLCAWVCLGGVKRVRFFARFFVFWFFFFFFFFFAGGGFCWVFFSLGVGVFFFFFWSSCWGGVVSFFSVGS